MTCGIYSDVQDDIDACVDICQGDATSDVAAADMACNAGGDECDAICRALATIELAITQLQAAKAKLNQKKGEQNCTC